MIMKSLIAPDGVALRVFVSGVFRSGTTFLARSLSRLDGFAFASDVFLPLFKSFRTAALLREGLTSHPDDPLDDYYGDTARLKRLIAIQEASLDSLSPLAPSRMWSGIRREALTYSPRLVDHLPDDQRGSFADQLRAGLDAITSAYGPAPRVGFKDVWATEFAGHFLKSFGESRVIILVRDPRAVYASNRASGARYPIPFIARQWRKQIAFLVLLRALYPERAIGVRFEGLVSAHRPTMDALASVIEVSEGQMMSALEDPRDDAGRPWARNSNFGNSDALAVQRAGSAWAISTSEIAMIELLCGPEMLIAGYPLTVIGRADRGLWHSEEFWRMCNAASDFEGSRVAPLADWIVPHAQDPDLRLTSEIARIEILNGDVSGSQDWNEHYLNRWAFEHARAHWLGGFHSDLLL